MDQGIGIRRPEITYHPGISFGRYFPFEEIKNPGGIDLHGLEPSALQCVNRHKIVHRDPCLDAAAAQLSGHTDGFPNQGAGHCLTTGQFTPGTHMLQPPDFTTKMTCVPCQPGGLGKSQHLALTRHIPHHAGPFLRLGTVQRPPQERLATLQGRAVNPPVWEKGIVGENRLVPIPQWVGL